jgi:hypothetical protein
LVELTTIDKLGVFYGTANLLDDTDGRISRNNQHIVSEGKIMTRLGVLVALISVVRSPRSIAVDISVTNSTAFAHVVKKDSAMIVV